MKHKTLPNTLHELLAVAIKDAKILDRQLYRPYALSYHTFDRNFNHCRVCLAGAVMVHTLEAVIKDMLDPEDYPKQTRFKLYALDQMRLGHFRSAYKTLYLCRTEIPDYIGQRLDDLPEPKKRNFSCWNDFDEHLKSLEGIQQELAKLDV